MTIIIGKNSTLSKIKYPLKQYIREKLDITDDMMENVAVTFSMIDDETGLYRIANVEGDLEVYSGDYEKLDEERYTLIYKPRLKDTKKAGIFRGEFKLDFLEPNCGKITLPVDDEIQIIISDSITKTSVI